MNKFLKIIKNYTLASVTLLCLMFFQTWSIQLNANTISDETTPFTVEVVTTHILCAEVCDGSALAVVTGGTPPFTFLWQNGDTRQHLDWEPAGLYEVTVTDADGHTASASGSINEPPPIVIDLDINYQNGSCPAGLTEVTATATGGTPGFTYEWSNGEWGTSVCLSPGNYWITVTDANGCKKGIDNFAIANCGLQVDVDLDYGQCGSNVATATATANVTGATAPISYNLQPGNIRMQTVTGLAPGRYTFFVRDAAGCKGEQDFEIFPNPGLDVSITGSNARCGQANGSATANATGGNGNYSYNWSNGETGAAISGLTPGNYSVTATDSDGCSGSETVTIIDDANLDVSITGSNARCGQANGSATANATGGNGNYSYTWSNGEMTKTITDLAPGNYSAIVTDSLGCMGSDTITIENDLDSIDVTILPHQDTVCLGDVLEISATTTYSGTNSLTYDWSPDNLIVSGDNTPTVMVSTDTPGTYQICVELSVDSTNCIGTTCTEYTVIEKKVIDPDTISYSQCDSLTIDFVGIDAQWFFDIDDLSLMSTGSNPSYTFPDTGTYKVLIVPNCPCPDTICKVVTVEPLSVDFDCDLTECIDTCKLTLTDISVVPGTITSWEWTIKDDNDQTVGTATGDTAIFDFPESGTYSITLRIEFGDSCVQEITKIKSMTCPAEPQNLSISVCLGDTTKFILPGGPNIIFTGSQDSMFTVDTLGNGCFIGWTPGTFEYCVTVTNNNCIDTIKVIGFCFSNPMVEIVGDSIVCDSSIVILDAVSADNNDYKWALDSSFVPIIGTNDTLLVQPDRPTTYYVMVTDDNGCTAIDEHTVGNYQVDISIIGNSIICHDDSTVLTLQNGNAGDTLDIIWSPLDIILNGQGTNAVTVKPPNNTVVFVETTNQFGCMATDSFAIQVKNPQVEIETDSTHIYKIGASHLFVPDTFATYTWIDGSTLDIDDGPEVTATPELTTIYQLTVTDSEGCEATDEIQITVLTPTCDRTQLFLPNAFTPNNDGLNDRLLIKGEIIEEFRIQIYDRWGKLVYESDNKDEGWDGTWLNQGEEASADVYGYCMSIVCICGEEYVESGNITILR